MMNEYKKIKLGDIVELSQGIQIPVDQQLPDSSHITQRFLRIVDYTKDNEPPRYVNVPQGRYNVNENDLVMVRYGSQTAGMIVRGKSGVIANNMFKMKANEEYIDKSYLYYYLSNPDVYKSLNHSQASSTMPAITFDMITSLEISLPPLSEQKRISNILSSFDNKIELLRKENNTLEDIAQSIFKEWFVKYNFPNKDGKPYRDNNGKMIDSELGLIPEGWRVGKLGEFCELKSGYAFKGNDFVDKGHTKVIKIKDLKGNGEIDLANLSSINDDSIKNEIVKKFLLSSGDILIAMSGNTTGKIGRMNKTQENVYLNQRVGKLFFKDIAYYAYVYNFLMVNNYEDKILSMGYGSAQPNINPSQIGNITITVPTSNLVANFNKIALLLMKKCLQNSGSLRILEFEKKFLLNKLIH